MRLPGTVWALGAVSFFTDVAGDMVFPLLPRYLAGMSGVGAAAVGFVEGIADAISHLAKPWAGRLSDRGKRKPFVLAGYAISGAARPALALAGSVLAVGVVRSLDRIGKGVRSAPRDALIAATAPEGGLARAFSVQRGMDHAGAVFGPVVASALLYAGFGVRDVFLFAAVPGLLALAVIALFVRDVEASPGVTAASAAGATAPLPPKLKSFLWIAFVFALGSSTDALLLLHAESMGVAKESIPLLWMLLHVVKVAASYPGGAIADRAGPVRTMAAGWLVYGAVYLGFALAAGPAAAWTLFLVYGVYHGLSEGAEKAIVSTLAPPGEKGRALGLFALALGAGTLIASAGAGLLYTLVSPAWAFGAGALMAFAATALLAVWASRGGSSRPAGAGSRAPADAPAPTEGRPGSSR